MAEVVATCRALEKLSAGNAWFDRDPVSNPQALRFTANPDDDSGTFVTEHVWTCHFECVDLAVFPEMYIGAVKGIS